MNHHNPSYLGGLAEIEPHYFRPTTPLYLQTMVSNTPFDRGDGIRPVTAPQLTTRQKYLSGPGCVPCRQNPIAMSGPYGFDWNTFKSQIGTGKNVQGFLESMTEEQKASVKGGVMSAASMYACENFGIGCPPEDALVYGESYPVNYPLIIGATVAAVAVLGGIFYVATR